jgi:WD40-like Beta Propeller Repeat
MNKKSYSQVLDHVARDNMAANTDLAPRILARIQKGKSANMNPRMKVLAAVVVALLVIGVVLMNVPAVRAAIQSWFGYVPGIGLVSEGQIRVLAEPVSVTRDEITLSIEQVLVDSAKTTLVYSIDGLDADMLDSNPMWNTPGCYKDATLRLRDDELAPEDQIGTSWMTGYEHKMTYPAIPSIVNEVTFVMPCIRSALPGKAPENWELSFRLIPAPPDMTAFPVIEISTPVAQTPTVLPLTEPMTDLSTDGISLALDRAVQMDDGYLIYATLHWENSRFSSIDRNDTSAIHLLDANGQEVAYTYDLDALSSMEWQPGRTSFALRIAPIQVEGPLTLVFDSVVVTVAVPVEATFTFDPGPDPEPGQVWELNKDIDVGYGHSLHVLRATYPKPPMENLPPQPGFSFEIESPTGVTQAMLFDKDHPVAGGGGGGGSFTGIFSAGFSYAGGMPDGRITVKIESIGFNLPTHLEASWTPPATTPKAESTPQLSACLTRETWQQALQAHASLPSNITGTLALSDLLPPTYNYEVSVAKLDGGGQKAFGFGFGPSLSPDGRRIVHQGPANAEPSDGLYITDLSSGNSVIIPGTGIGDMGPLWSRDGQKIAFTRGPSSGLIGAPGAYNLMLMNVDGSDLSQLTYSEGANYLMAWMPDGVGILYTSAIREGVSINLMNTQSGETRTLFDLNYNATVVVSPDGKRLAFEEMLPLDKYGLFVSDLDGSNRKLLADGNPYIVTVPYWSPDGDWVIASVHNSEADNEFRSKLALIQPDTCQIIALPDLTGYVSSWLP